MEALIIGIGALVVGLILGVIVALLIRAMGRSRRTGAAQDEAARILGSAEEEKKRALLEAQEEALKAKQEAEAELRDRRREVQRVENRLASRSESLDNRQESIELREHRVGDREQDVEQRYDEAESLKAEQATKLEQVANLSVQEAKAQIMQSAEDEAEHELAKRYYALEQKMLNEVDDKAKKTIALSIQRLASDVG